MKKIVPCILVAVLTIFCGSSQEKNQSKSFNYTYAKGKNPELFGKDNLTENLDYIFNLDSLGKCTITIARSEWNKLLQNYDAYYKNEIYVHCDFEYEKGKEKWIMPDSGFRLRGNTTRVRPSGPDFSHAQGNHRWSDWKTLEKAKENEYRQASFKVDFEEFLEEGENGKLASSIKGLNLKRFQADPSYIREIYSMDLMRRYGVWTAPRVAYTKLKIRIFEDLTTGKYTSLNYGIYEMFENIDKQSLKERKESVQGAWTSTKGNLWKCSDKAFLNPWSLGDDFIGVEELTINEKESKLYRYDLKSNKKNLAQAKQELEDFVYALDELKFNNPEEIKKSKAWIDSHIEVELLLKTMACNVILGMDDDYWANANNFYLYFDTAQGGTGKVYMIPFDYDHVFGNPVGGDAVNKNPLDWGKASGAKPGERPLVEKILAIEEYNELYKSLLLEFSSEDSEFGQEKSTARIKNWQKLVKNHIRSSDLTYDHDTCPVLLDTGGYAGKKYYLFKKPNVWEGKRKSIETALGM